MKLAINVDDEDRFASNERLRLVDLAYKIDPKLAEEVADLGDDDPARVRARHQMSQEIAVLKLKKSIINKEDESVTSSGPTQAQSQEAAWRTLAELNAGRVPLFTKDQAREHFRRGAAFSLEDSYPSFLLALSSLVRKYANNDEARAYLRPMFDGLVRSTEIAWQVIARTVGATPPLAVDVLMGTDSSICVEPGEKESALAFIDKWVTDNVKDGLIICDPYFGFDDLELLMRIQNIVPFCEFKILTSMKHQQQTTAQGLNGSIPDLYSNHWRQLTQAQPPFIELYVCQSELDNRSPLHDRWMVSDGAGLSIGSSFNSLGTTRCFIDYLQPAAARLRAAEFEKLVLKQMKTPDGQRVKYLNFSV
jgi:hypothetical protein